MKNYWVNKGNQVRFLTRPFVSSLAKDEEQFALEQNGMIYDFVKKNFKLQPFLITRDRSGNIIVVERKSAQNGNLYDSFEFKVFGINTSEGTLNLFTAGYLNYVKYDSTYDPITMSYVRGMFVTKLAVHKRFQQSGLGSIMLQTLENLASTKGYSYIKLNSLRSFDVRNDIIFPNARIIKAIRQIKSDEPLTEKAYWQIKNPEVEKFLRKSMFNRNLFFYNSNGYHGTDVDSAPQNQDALKKDSLDIRELDLGLIKRPTPYSPANEEYALPEDADPIITLNQSYGESLFSSAINYYEAKDFVPVFVDPSKAGTSQLKKMLSSIPPTSELSR